MTECSHSSLQHGKDDGKGDDVDGVNPPVAPHRDGGHNEGIVIEQGARLVRVILA